MHVLDNGICVDCRRRSDGPHYLVDGLCEHCSDNEPLGEAEQALVVALDELDGKAAVRAAWDPEKHPRGPGGKFRSIVDRLKDAIEKHHRGEGDGHPFDGFSREQLRRVAKARGIELKRGEDRDSIAAKLLDHIGMNPSSRKPVGKPKSPSSGVAPEPTGSAARYHLDLHGAGHLADAVEHSKVVEEKTFDMGNIGDTRYRRYADGTELVWKRGGEHGDPRESDAEQLSSLLGRALGLHAPRIYRNEPDAVNMEFVHGRPAVDEVGPAARHVGERWTAGDEGRALGLLDVLINNQDRHNGNWMVTGNGSIVPIDHGYAFPAWAVEGGDPRVPSFVKSPFADPFMSPLRFDNKPRHWLKHDYTSDDMRELRRRIQALQPDFWKLNRQDWHDFIMARFDALAAKASGTTSRLLPSGLE